MKKERDDKIKLVGEIMDLEKSSIDSGEIEVSDKLNFIISFFFH
jgi:hypothetical protein